MATNRAFKTLLKKAQELRSEAHEFLSLLESLQSMRSLLGGGDPEGFIDEEDRNTLDALVEDVREFDVVS